MKAPLTPKQIERLHDAYMGAVDAGDPERERIIAQIAAADAELGKLLRRMLDLYGGPGATPFDTPLFDLSVALRGIDGASDGTGEASPSSAAGHPDPWTTWRLARRSILPDMGGRYEPIRLIGNGSAGDVYLARELRATSRLVALKVFRPVVVGSAQRHRSRLKRFVVEARALAALAHPGIARVFEAGETGDGRPFLAMEFVEGAPIDEACDRAGLDATRILRLFVELCGAVQHAHQQGILHRDLKPANVLAVARDGALSVKVIDFGLAKLIDPSEPGFGTLTLQGEMLGTFDYMSPEQFRGGPADTRSDVFSLGVMLYRLLTKRLPFLPPGGDGGVLPDHRRPPAPMPEVPPRLRRDVETVVGKALAVDPGERYATPAHLAEDLERILTGVPIIARRPSGAERVVKFARRRPWTMVAVTIVATALLGAVVAVVVSRQRLLEETAAQRELITATIDHMLDEVWVFIGSEPVREKLIDRMLQRTDELLRAAPDDPGLLLARARLLRALGYLHGDRGHAPGMLRACRESLAVYDRLADGREDDVDFIRAHAEALVRVGDALDEARRAVDPGPVRPDPDVGAYYGRAEAMLRDAAERHRDHLGLRDDLCWSCIRLLQFEAPDARNARLLRCVELASALHADTPDRDLSKYALAAAHRQAAVHLAGSSARPGDQDELAVRRAHAIEAHRLSHEFVRSQPHRGAFLMEHFANLAVLLQLSLATSIAPLDEHAVCEELEAALCELDAERWSRSDVQVAAVDALGWVGWHHMLRGRHDRAGDAARRLVAVAADPAVSWTSGARALIEQWTRTFCKAGCLDEALATEAVAAQHR